MKSIVDVHDVEFSSFGRSKRVFVDHCTIKPGQHFPTRKGVQYDFNRCDFIDPLNLEGVDDCHFSFIDCQFKEGVSIEDSHGSIFSFNGLCVNISIRHSSIKSLYLGTTYFTLPKPLELSLYDEVTFNTFEIYNCDVNINLDFPGNYINFCNMVRTVVRVFNKYNISNLPGVIAQRVHLNSVTVLNGNESTTPAIAWMDSNIELGVTLPDEVIQRNSIAPLKGPFIAYKRVFLPTERTMGIATGLVEEGWRRVALGRKIRVEAFKVLSVKKYDGTDALRGVSPMRASSDGAITYMAGMTAKPHTFDPSNTQCSDGIHVFMTEHDAKYYKI